MTGETNSAAQCRVHAAECRRWVEQTQNPALKEAYNRIASEWEKLADEIDKHNGKNT